MKKIISIMLMVCILITTTSINVMAAESDELDYKLLADTLSESEYLNEELSKLGVSLQYIADLPQREEEFYKKAEEFANKTIPSGRSIYVNEPTLQTLSAQRVVYAGECAKWSKSKNSSIDEKRESLYMYLSHYVDVAYPLDPINGVSNNSLDPYCAKYITDYDRRVYSQYLSRGSASRAAAAFESAISTSIGVATDLRSAYDIIKSKKITIAQGSVSLKSFELDVESLKSMRNAFNEAMESGKSPEAIEHEVRKSLKFDDDKYNAEISNMFTGLLFSVLSPGIPFLSILSVMNFYTHTLVDIYDRANFASMRLTQNFRIIDRIDYYYEVN